MSKKRHDVTAVDIYLRLGRAYSRGTGMRLSAEEVWTLYETDDAISEAVSNAEEEQESFVERSPR